MISFAVRDKIEVTYRNQNGDYRHIEGEIVHIFRNLEIPRTSDVLRYYGQKAKSPNMARVFGANVSDRIVVCYGPEYFIVLPLQGLGKYFTMSRIEE